MYLCHGLSVIGYMFEFEDMIAAKKAFGYLVTNDGYAWDTTWVSFNFLMGFCFTGRSLPQGR